MLTIDSEFQALIPALATDERDALEASILAEGCRDAIVVWHHDDSDIIVDGHNRYAICTAHGLPYNVVTRDFSSRSEVMLWMIRNQLARRNLTPFKRTELALQMEAVIAEQAQANMAAGGLVGANMTNRGLHNYANPEPINTRKEVGRIAEVSHDTVRKVKNVLDGAPAAIVDKARAGDLSIHAAERMTTALRGLPDAVVEVALRLADDNADKVQILAGLYKSNGRDGSNQTFDEIATNGGFHYGDEMDEWCDFTTATVKEINSAKDSVARYHATIEAQAKDAAREALKHDLAVRASGAILSDQIQVHHADCIEFLHTLPDESIDLILIDPPYYGVVSDAWDNQWASQSDYLSWCEQWMRQSLRVLKPTGSFYIWGAVGSVSDSIIHQKLLLDRIGFTFRDWITWQKRRGRGNVRGWLYTREEVLWYVKDNAHYVWNTDEQYSDEPNQFKVGMGGHAVKSEFKRITNVWTDIPEQLTRKDTLHYTPKPQAALERIIKAHTHAGDVVLDFFSGSGSTGLAAQSLNRRCILVDADEQSYIETKARVGASNG